MAEEYLLFLLGLINATNFKKMRNSKNKYKQFGDNLHSCTKKFKGIFNKHEL